MNNKMAIPTYLSTITLNANRRSAPIKRHTHNTKQDLYICCLQETHCTLTDTHRLKVK